MSRKTNSYNAYETSTTGPLGIGAASVAVDSAAGLVAPLYLVIDPDNPLKREWIRVNTINANTLENIVRNQEGSVGDVAHDAGAKIRSVPTKQIFDDIFQDAEDDELNLTQHQTDGGDPHASAGYLKQNETDALYLRLVGGTLSGPLTLSADPTSNLHAATKQYADARETAAIAYSDSLDHHTKYTDGEAVTAVGPHTTKYTDTEARSAVDNGTYLKLTGGVMTDELTVDGPVGTRISNIGIKYDGITEPGASGKNVIGFTWGGGKLYATIDNVATVEIALV